LPDGEAAPADGALPPGALAAIARRPLGIYVHVPFCAARCGYCDFNTYTASELGGFADPSAYVDAALAEVFLARRVLGEGAGPVTTIFFGGGTPSLLRPEQIGAILRAIDECFGIEYSAEITLEANPESVDSAYLTQLRQQGPNRLSLGMQSAREHVLAVLDRRHTAGRVPAAVAWARAAGFASVSVDLIYGSPGETLEDWRASVEAAIDLECDHVSAYSLIVEPGTAMARRVARGELPPPDDDDLADKYELADRLLGAAGYLWYEVSNWARPGHECRHNLGYWRSDNWWGIGPGAHSHVGGVRWWNVKHPAAYADRLAAGRSPAHGREVLTDATARTEKIMLGLRLAAGLPGRIAPREMVDDLVRAGLLQPRDDRLILTRRGRLLADRVVNALVDAPPA
jgi:oxygen-independent coproporphyrinogen-3 oxidase